MATAETIKQKANAKLQRRRAQRANCYNKNKDAVNKRRREQYNVEKIENKTKWADYKNNQRRKRKEEKTRERNRKREYRERHKLRTERDDIPEIQIENAFANRQSRSRAMKRLKNSLPKTPEKRIAIVQQYTIKSPTMDTLRKQIGQSSTEDCVPKHVLDNMKEFVQSKKMKRSNEARVAMTLITASVSGENISDNKVKVSLAKRLGLHTRRIAGGKRVRTKVLTSERSCYEYISRKTRSDAISEDNKKLIYNFWLSPRISRVTGNKKDVKRVRIAPKQYTSHPTHILEKTQTEAFIEFKEEYPNIKIAQRAFESLKPFFVVPVRIQDRDTCCCRSHIEMRSVFKRCMDFRRSVLKTSMLDEDEKRQYPVYERLNDIVDATLCARRPLKKHHEHKCLNRECSECGITDIAFLPEEVDNSHDAADISWERYEYITTKIKGGKQRRKLQLVKKQSKPGYMFDYFTQLLRSFPSHQFRALWQNNQYKYIADNLPLHHALCVHDYSENYRCSDISEIQTGYFQKTEVTIHVSILHRHSVLELDGQESTLENPNIIAEQFFVISPDLEHDRYFSCHVQKEISNYLHSIGSSVDVMHEFCDGCSCQYKSRKCMGDISCACEELKYKRIVRNYYETSHAKGPQDAAGGFLKRQADMAVMRRKVSIQNAADMTKFATDWLQQPQSGIYKRRIFKYVDSVQRDPPRNDYVPVNSNRKIHQITADKRVPYQLKTRELSCYECNRCLSGSPEQCTNQHQIGEVKTVKMKQSSDNSPDEEESAFTFDLSDLVSTGSVVAVLTDDPSYEYYLMKVVEPTHILDTDEVDNWGNAFPSGASVIKGLYYERVNGNMFEYKLIRNRHCLIYSVAVRYIVTEKKATHSLKLAEPLHENILESMDI